ncbi:MAG: YbaK/EbsC family protein, partial [Trebonia sp.]
LHKGYLTMSRDGHTSTYTRLVSILEDHDIEYSVIDHAPEGRTSAASVIRGHPLSQAAKCMVVEIRMARHALCVVPGDVRIDLAAVCELYNGTRASLAPQDTAERLTYCQRGAIIPFSFRPGELDLIADPGLLGQERLYFNAARLDRSLGISADDFLRAAKPRLAKIADYENS